ncbi:T-cell surface glycoprotein CD1a-like [Cynocephalus volans]|uniref:T-cell surface glycoprotein CD1a-like n=1 Tax=Cynocephalus volans TaxID=110931 RepID=UPI002FC662F9
MLFLLLPLLAVLLPGSHNEYGFEEPVSFHVTQISSFHNRSWTQTLLSGWLDEFHIHTWDSNSGTIIFLQPWSRGNFSNEEFMKIENFLHLYLVRFAQAFHDYIHRLRFEYPFEIQMTAGCELHPGGVSVDFLWTAYQGSDFLSFQNNSWLPSPKGGSSAQLVCKVLNQDKVYTEMVQTLLSDTCPRFILGILDSGKADLQRQVKPEAWLSSGPSPGPGRLLLVCHVSGFYPKPIWVMWMRNEQEQLDTRQGDVLPNADGTWYLQATLEVNTGEVADLTCRVKHSSLGGQDIILYWEHHSSMGLIFLAVILLLALLAGLAFWFWKCW